jgi:hypothetical protein
MPLTGFVSPFALGRVALQRNSFNKFVCREAAAMRYGKNVSRTLSRIIYE